MLTALGSYGTIKIPSAYKSLTSAWYIINATKGDVFDVRYQSTLTESNSDKTYSSTVQIVRL
jgi:hypothetical protein